MMETMEAIELETDCPEDEGEEEEEAMRLNHDHLENFTDPGGGGGEGGGGGGLNGSLEAGVGVAFHWGEKPEGIERQGEPRGSEAALQKQQQNSTGCDNHTIRALPGVGTIISTRTKSIDTAIILALVFSSGVNYMVMGLTLLDLERQIASVDTDTAADSVLFICRGAGILAGCSLAGPLFDRVNHALLLAPCTVFIGVGHLLLPACRHVYSAAAVFVLQAFGVGILNVGSTFAIVKHWGRRAAPFLHSQMFMYDLAAIVAPLVQKLFIITLSPPSADCAGTDTALAYNSSYFTDAHVMEFYRNMTTVANTMSPAASHDPIAVNGFFVVSEDDPEAFLQGNCTASSSIVSKTDMLGYNCLIGSFILLVAFLDLLMVGFYRTAKNIWQIDGDSERVAPQNERLTRKKEEYINTVKSSSCDNNAGRVKDAAARKPLLCVKIWYIRTCDVVTQVRITLFTALLTLIYSIEGVLLALTVVYLVKGLHWDLRAAMTLSAVRGLLCGAFRFLMIFMSRVLGNSRQVFLNCVLCTAAVALMVGCVLWAPRATWALLLASSVALSSMYASALSWASEQIRMSGLVSAVFTSPFATGLLVGPTVASYIFDRHGAHWFVYLLFIYVLVLDALVGAVVVFRNAFPPRAAPAASVVNGNDDVRVPSGSTRALNDEYEGKA